MLIVGDVQANSLVGDVISAEIDSPLGVPELTATISPSPFIVGSGVEAYLVGAGTGQQLASFDFSANQLVITFFVDNLNPSPFAGPVFTVLSGNPFDQIASVSGISASSVFETNDGGGLVINWANSFNVIAGNQIVVTFSVPAPVVGTGLPSMLAVLAGSGFLGWRRRRTEVHRKDGAARA
jgi:hypothetical protein